MLNAIPIAPPRAETINTNQLPLAAYLTKMNCATLIPTLVIAAATYLLLFTFLLCKPSKKTTTKLEANIAK